MLELESELIYTASLVDKTAGSETKAISETIKGASGFAAKSGSVPLVAGHAYAIRIASTASQNTVGIGLGTTSARFDNVRLVGPGPDENGGGGKNGNDGNNGGKSKDGISNARLATLVQSSLIGPAVLKGNRLFVKAKCPASIGHSCSNSLLGLLTKGKSATTKRTAKVGSGQTKQMVLRVKPKAKDRVSRKSRLLFEERVRAGGAKATVYKRLKLIRRR